MGFRDSRVYRRALELVQICQELEQGLPAGRGFLGEQVRRSAASVVLNFAEGYSKRTATEQRRFFNIALASAQETLAAFDVARALNAMTPALHAHGCDVADHVSRMLAKFHR